eukprot:TRINITY_DN3322_c0_g1_i2.p1 TRINITY_DN3322_c0_g1~~TRINITY_DN3322_c0_g1_i2.p1  ORF type:complete len:125 (-),score=3.21 TRINITY_DN3322_c0_g1_i2:21-395(-)
MIDNYRKSSETPDNGCFESMELNEDGTFSYTTTYCGHAYPQNEIYENSGTWTFNDSLQRVELSTGEKFSAAELLRPPVTRGFISGGPPPNNHRWVAQRHNKPCLESIDLQDLHDLIRIPLKKSS